MKEGWVWQSPRGVLHAPFFFFFIFHIRPAHMPQAGASAGVGRREAAERGAGGGIRASCCSQICCQFDGALTFAFCLTSLPSLPSSLASSLPSSTAQLKLLTSYAAFGCRRCLCRNINKKFLNFFLPSRRRRRGRPVGSRGFNTPLLPHFFFFFA